MKKICFLTIIFFFILIDFVRGAAPTRQFVYTSGETIEPSEVTTNEDQIFNYLTAGVDTLANNSVTSAKIVDATIATADIANNAVNGAKIAIGSDAQGDVIYYNGTDYVRLGAGTSGQFLKTQGVSADVIWADAAVSPLTLTAANSSSQVPLTIVQNDVTNDPTCLIVTNNGEGKGITITQNQAASDNGLFITTDKVQGTNNLVKISQTVGSGVVSASLFSITHAWKGTLIELNSTNSSQTSNIVSLTNAGTGSSIDIIQNGVLAGGRHGLRVTSDSAHVNADSALLLINQDNASATEPALEILNDGSGVQIEGDGDENLSNAGVWTDRTSTLADKDIISEIILPEFMDKLKSLKLYSYQKKCEVYGNKKNDLEEIDELDYDKGNSSHKKKGNKFYKKVGEKKYPTQKKNPNAKIFKGYILDDPTTPEELISRDLEGNINGISAMDGVNFLLGVCKELIEKLEDLEVRVTALETL